MQSIKVSPKVSPKGPKFKITFIFISPIYRSMASKYTFLWNKNCCCYINI